MPTEVFFKLESENIQFFSDLYKENKISDNVLITHKRRTLRAAAGAPELIEIVIELSKKISVEQALVDIALGLIANWLYDKIRNRNANVKLDGEPVKDKESIKKKIKNKVRSVEYYQAEFSLPKVSEEELVKSARTLCDRPIVFNSIQLSYPENTTLFSDYVDGLIKAEVQIADKEVMKIFNEGKSIYAKPEMDAQYFQLLKKILFTRLILSSDVPAIPEEWVILKSVSS